LVSVAEQNRLDLLADKDPTPAEFPAWQDASTRPIAHGARWDAE